MDELELRNGGSIVVNPQTLVENGTELDHSELPGSELRSAFLKAHGLREGTNTAFYSTSAGKQPPEWIEWYAFEHTLRQSYAENDDAEEDVSVEGCRELDQSVVKEEEDELTSEPGGLTETGPIQRRLLHTRHLTTNYPLMMKKMKGGTWKNVDFHEGEERDHVTNTLSELMKRGERVPLPLKGPLELVPGRTSRNYLKHPVTSPLGTIKTRGEAGRPIFLLHAQLSDTDEMEDYHAHGLIMNDKMLREAERPQFRETWFNSLALSLDSPQCPFEVDVHVVATLYPYVGPTLRTGQNGKWTLAFDTELKIYGKLDALIARPILTPALSEHLRRVLHVFLPSPNRELNTARGDITLQEFYDILQPAPSPPADVLRLVQPEGMLAKLKPFQQRAVAWLLQNENATSVHPYFERRSTVDPEGLWETIQFGVEDQNGPVELAFCRMTGSLQPISPVMINRKKTLEKGKGKQTDNSHNGQWLSPEEGLLRLCDVRGSLLAEEMGKYWA